MPAEIIKTIKSSGGDYTSLSAWEAARNADLTVSDTIETAECYNFTDTTGVIIQGWTTDPTRYIKIYTPTAERHTGTAGTGYRLIVSGARALQIREGHVRTEGLEIRASGDFSGIHVDNPDALPASPYILVKDCLVYNCGSTAGLYHGIYLGRCGAASYPMNIINTVIYGCKGDGIRADSGNAAAIVDILNCTVNNNAGYGIRKNSNSTTVQVKNCYAGANTTADYSSSSGTWTAFTTNASSDTTGTSGLQSIAHSTSSGAYFTNVTAGSENYHIGASSALKDVGTDLSATFTTDIDGATRSGTWDIGADEITAGGSTYNESLTLGVSAGHAYSGNLIMEGTLALSTSAGMAETGGFNLNDSIALAGVLSQAQSHSLTVNEAVSFAVSAGITEAATLDAIASITLALNGGLTTTANTEMNASLSLATALTLIAAYLLDTSEPAKGQKVVMEAAKVFKAILDSRTQRVNSAGGDIQKGVKH